MVKLCVQLLFNVLPISVVLCMHANIFGGRNNRNSGSSESSNGASKEITIDPSEFNILESEMDSTSPSNGRQPSKNMNIVSMNLNH